MGWELFEIAEQVAAAQEYCFEEDRPDERAQNEHLRKVWAGAAAKAEALLQGQQKLASA